MNRPRRRRRVFIGLTEVAGYYANLERGLRAIGVDARFVDLSVNPFQFGRAATKARSGRQGSGPPLARRVRWWMYRARRAAGALALFVPAVVRYDTFVFYGLDSFLGFRDLPILKLLGKRLIYVFNGTDHRPPYMNGKSVRDLRQHHPGWLVEQTRIVADRVDRVERHADVIVGLANSAQFHRRQFVEFLAVGVPFHPPGIELGAPLAPSDDAVRVLHCPTDPISKGTDRIRTAIENLRGRGHRIDYVEIVGRPNSEVLQAIRMCDFVVDEVWSDTPMAGFATEAAFYGKPAVVGGYFADDCGAGLEPDLQPPTLVCLPNDLDSAIERLVVDRAFRLELGARAKAFVSHHWQPAMVAARFVRLIEGDIPESWLRSPGSVTYAHGWGLPEDLLGEGIRAVLDSGGVRGLRVGHNPPLEARLLSIAA